MSTPPPNVEPEEPPSILRLMVLIAGSAVGVLFALGLTLHAPIWVVCLASTLPVFLWLAIVREMVKLLTWGEDDDSGDGDASGDDAIRKPGRTSW